MRVVVVICLSLLITFSIGELFNSKWPEPTGTGITSVSWIGDAFIGTGADGTLLHSDYTGSTWAQCESPGPGYLLYFHWFIFLFNNLFLEIIWHLNLQMLSMFLLIMNMKFILFLLEVIHVIQVYGEV